MAFPTTSLLARYEAKLDTGHLDGDALATIPDQSGGGLTLSQATAGNRPTYRTGVAGAQPAYRFDGAGDCEQRAGALTLTAVSVTVVCSSEPSEDASRSWPFGVFENIASFPRIFAVTEAATAGEWGSFVRTSATTLQQATSGVDTTGWTVLTLTWDGTTARLYRNGTLVTSGAIGGTLDGIDTISMGAVTGSTFGGDIALAGLWNAALDATARADLHSYVQDTYGITVSDYAGTAGPTAAATEDESAAITARVRTFGSAAAAEEESAQVSAIVRTHGALAASEDEGVTVGGVHRVVSEPVRASEGEVASLAARVRTHSTLAAREDTSAAVEALLRSLSTARAAEDETATARIGARGYLTGRVRMVPALSGTVTARPALTGTITLTPADR